MGFFFLSKIFPEKEQMVSLDMGRGYYNRLIFRQREVDAYF